MFFKKHDNVLVTVTNTAVNINNNNINNNNGIWKNKNKTKNNERNKIMTHIDRNNTIPLISRTRANYIKFVIVMHYMRIKNIILRAL